MIYVTSGHENGIGLECFFKAYLCLSTVESAQITLISTKEIIQKELNLLKIDFNFKDNCVSFNQKSLSVIFCPGKKNVSLESLELALEKISPPSDTLLTLPTTKNQLTYHGSQCRGYTDYLRKKYPSSELNMFFHHQHMNLLMLTEHIPLHEVKNLSAQQVVKKIETTINSSYPFLGEMKKFTFLGINPHASEGGLIGQEDEILVEAIKILKSKFSAIEFNGPISGDTAYHLYSGEILVSPFHDQGLTLFKTAFGYSGANITLGLPFLRLSPDHGTAFNLYGQDRANFYSLLEVLRIAIENNTHGFDQHH
jgi:4-hydroxythreonine-4-phosphate dehydrogenase